MHYDFKILLFCPAMEGPEVTAFALGEITVRVRPADQANGNTFIEVIIPTGRHLRRESKRTLLKTVQELGHIGRKVTTDPSVVFVNLKTVRHITDGKLPGDPEKKSIMRIFLDEGQCPKEAVNHIQDAVDTIINKLYWVQPKARNRGRYGSTARRAPQVHIGYADQR